MLSTHFDPIHTPLLKDINLIEASAGTGKTYAIAMLVLRFVVEQNIDIKKILVVTFTKAATEELKDRIRARLADAKSALLEDTGQIDSNIIKWLATLSLDHGIIKSRLELALLDIDQAGIFTIHGFCQRVLSEHALESGELFDSELTGEIDAIKQACADDFWRIHVYTRKAWEAALLTAHFANPDALLASVQAIPMHSPVLPEGIDLKKVLQSFEQLCIALIDTLPAMGTTLKNAFAEGTFKPAYTEEFDQKFQTLMNWLQCFQASENSLPNDELTWVSMLPDFGFLSTEGVLSGLNGNKFRKTKDQTGEQRKADYLATLAIDFAGFDTLHESYRQIALSFRRSLLDYLWEHLDKRLWQLNVLSFDDLISRLAKALQEATETNSAFLTAELQQRYSVALIDEFQDTDQKQWFIFSTLFGHSEHSLYLIGDPKQAIYKFRGADIYSYFTAQKQAKQHFTLGYNWRSHPKLVAAVNRLFQREQPFLFNQVGFTPALPGLEAADGYLDEALPPLQLWQLAESDSKTGYWTSAKAAIEIRIATTNEILRLLKSACKLIKQTSEQVIQPRDIAILVRTNQQARDFQQILREVGIPAVLNSTESVFSAREALDLYRLLQALANPGDIGLLKQALTLSWFGMDGQQLYRTINDETLLDPWISRFQEYHQIWIKKGFMAMLKHMISTEKVTEHLSKSRFAERRLTNLQHLIELIQQAVLNDHLGMQKTLDWLGSAITKAKQQKNSAEEQQLRLESDEDAVKIVTMHRSKGLEYAVVFCPFLWQRNDFLNSEKHLIQCHENGQMLADIGSTEFEKHRAQALQEEIAEDLRVFYVAVTRAKYRCYVVWANVRSNEKPNNSAMAYLLGFADADYASQQQCFKAYAEEQPEAFHYQELAAVNSLDEPFINSIDTETLTAKQRQRKLYTNWQMSSYTALSALSLADTPELPEDRADETLAIEPTQDTFTMPLPELTIDPLPKGAQTGNAIHALLEQLSFEQCAKTEAIAQKRDAICQKFGLKLTDPTLVDELLKRVVSTSLSSDDPTFCLKNLNADHCLKELPFYLSMQTLDAAQINPILATCPAYQSLTAKQMCGFLTGFIDLICEYQGRYYVIDYKSNALPDYQPDTLVNAMREHNYGLQYWLYSVVLHRFLAQRLPDYSYFKHFGGVRYLFVRGMQPDYPGSGVYEDLPEFGMLEKLTALFGD